MDKGQIRSSIQSFFFTAMMEGWAGGGKETTIPDMPGFRAYSFIQSDLYLLDRFCVIPDSPRSAGTTTIWVNRISVWTMNYGGSYHKDAIRFLKGALLKNYEARHFVGGRGPLVYAEDALVYINQPRLNDFAKFEGCEKIFNGSNGNLLGFHDYWGMSLL